MGSTKLAPMGVLHCTSPSAGLNAFQNFFSNSALPARTHPNIIIKSIRYVPTAQHGDRRGC